MKNTKPKPEAPRVCQRCNIIKPPGSFPGSGAACFACWLQAKRETEAKERAKQREVEV